MSDGEKEVPEARGADWEVVTLTASAYAEQRRKEQRKAGCLARTARLLPTRCSCPTTSCPPPPHTHTHSEHENLPIETALLEPQMEESTSVEGATFNDMGGSYDDGSEAVRYYDEGKNLSVHEAEMMGDVAEHGSLFHAGDGFAAHDDDSLDKTDAPPQDSGSAAPCQCWLKKHMSCLYDQAKETNTLWGAVVVAALVGLVILWRKDKLHMSCLKWRSRSAVS